MGDLYVQILVVLYREDLTKEQQASLIRSMINEQVVQKFQELIADYQKECGK